MALRFGERTVDPMILPVLHYGDPILRKKGARIESPTTEIHQLIADMFDTMYAAKGVGLAAQQVGRALQLTVIDVRGIRDRPSQVWLDGREMDLEAFMPLVLINPRITPTGEPARGPEGCLSFPEIFGDVERATEVDVIAQNERGDEFHFKAGGLLARAIQHEVDHLNGLLFIDRMDRQTFQSVKDEIDTLQNETRALLANASKAGSTR